MTAITEKLRDCASLVGRARRSALGVIAGAAVLAAVGCDGSNGSNGAPGAPGASQPTSTTLDPTQDPPGVVLAITNVSGGSGNGGNFEVGNHVTVDFDVHKKSGAAWNLSEMSSVRIYLSGPTFNYQRIFPDRSDVIALAVKIADGSYRYTFPDPIPANYVAPLNDSASFGPADGELQGQPLLGGTYTVGLESVWTYTVEGSSFRDVGNATKDFLFGAANSIEPREVVTTANCNACHKHLQAHGGNRNDVRNCVLCHTSGAEDRNTATAANGTPGVSIDFRVLIHKIHMGSSLPSVLGITTNAQGDRDYTVEGQPYQIVGFRDSVNDFSDITFPVWPNLNIAMPRDQGYSALSSDAKAKDDAMRFGPTDCAKCHGDPDGAGPLPAPAQGNLAFSEPSRRACGACHDDVVWSNPYRSNGQTMPANLGDDTCLLCHMPTGNAIATHDAHLHPLLNPSLNAGLAIHVTPASKGDGSGRLDPGEPLGVTIDITDDSGAAVAPSALGSSLSVVVSGPTTNRNLLLNGSIPTSALTGSPPFTVNVPEAIAFELIGHSTSLTGDVFNTSRAPIWTASGVATTVQVRTATGPAMGQLVTASTLRGNTADLDTTSGFARDDVVVLDDGLAAEEYAKVALVDGNRLWFTTPLRFAHPAGAMAARVTLMNKVAGTDFILDAAGGHVTEVTEFGDTAAVLLSYTSDFLIPSVYPAPLNDSPDLDETWGEWEGKSLVDGTYQVGIWGSRSFTVSVGGEDTSYRSTAPAGIADFLVGSASTIQDDTIISSPSNCYACHEDLYFHGGGRRGLPTCLLCHATAGSEDRARWVAANAPPTTDVTIDYRTMLHKIHMGANLPDAETYQVVGFGSSAYPNNFGVNDYADVEFPALPGGPKECEKCHGDGSVSWHEPSDRSHPTEQGAPARVWRSACGSCHSSTSAQSHIALQTDASGQESCAVCHGEGRQFMVSLEHKSR
jgi:decaheme cytochrome c component MtrC/MtrF-like protein